MYNEELTKTVEWEIITSQSGTALHVTCPLCGQKLTYAKDTYLLKVDNQDRRLRYLVEAIEECMCRHLGRDDNYPMAKHERTCTSIVQVDIDAEWDKWIILAHDGRYWVETYRYDDRFGIHDWELEPLTGAYTEWLDKLLTEQAELVRVALANQNTLLTISEWLKTKGYHRA